MRISIILILFLAMTLPSLSSTNTPNNSDAILGTWLVQEKDGQIEVFKCGNKYCAKIVWLQKAVDEKGQPRKDINNPNANLRSRTLINMVFLENFVYDAKSNEWSGGSLYDARSGKSYNAYVKVKSNGDLVLTGYILGMRWLSKSNTWTRIK